MRCFALDLSATQTAEITGISVRSVNPIYLRWRQWRARKCERHPSFKGNLEADQSYFGPRRVRGKRGHGAGAKTIVFCLLKRDDRVYTEIVPNVSRATLRAAICNHADLESVIHTDRWSGYDGLVDLGYERHRRVSHGENQFALGPTTSTESRASGAMQNTA